MGPLWRHAIGLHARFTLVLLGAGLLLGLAGHAATLRIGGSSAIDAMRGACGLAVGASALAAIPISLAKVKPNRETLLSVLLGSIALRLALLALGGAAVLLAGVVPAKPFLLWLGIAHLVLLPIDTWYALRLPRQFRKESAA